MSSGRTIVFLLIGFSCITLVPTAAGQAPVEPLLQKYCLGCHNSTEKEGGLSLQTPQELKKGGENGPVYDPGQPEMSLLVRVLADGAELAMPPEGEPQPTAEERARLRAWVLAGAQIRPMATGRPTVPEVKPHQSVTPALLASTVLPDGGIAVGGGRHVTGLDPVTGAIRWRTELQDVRVTNLMTASNKPWIVAASGMPGVGGTALLLSASDGKTLKEFGGHTDAIYAAVLNVEGTVLATAGYDRRILLHDVATGKILRVLEGHNGSVFSLSFDPAGKVLCSASADGTVKVWSVGTGQRLDTLSQPTAEQYAVVVSHDGRLIYAAGADNRIRAWKLVSRDRPKINPIVVARFAHERPITRLALSPDGTILASVAEDGTIQIWQTNPLTHHQTLPRQDKAVTSLAFPSAHQLFLTRLDGTTGLLDVSKEVASGDVSVAAHTPEPAAVRLPDELNAMNEVEGNDEPGSAQPVKLPAKISGTIKPDGGDERDADCFRFTAAAGQKLILEINAQRNKSHLDSKIEVVTSDGRPIVRTVLQAVRDSYFTFRGKDSDTANDFRVFNWQEMELNEYLYSDGEVVKLWHYPRGPDSGYIVYPGFGNRFTYFDTTPTAHALQAPCFIVVPHRPDDRLTPNGLPTFPIHYENDDDGRRELGRDSRLFFTAPETGDYVVRVTDARGFSGEQFHYELTVRAPKPRFQVTAGTRKISLSPGTGREIVFSAKRIDGFEGPITVDVNGLPNGFVFSGPIEIQREQLRAMGIIYATDQAAEVTAEQLQQVRITATAEGHAEQDLGKLEELKLLPDPKLSATIEPIASPDGGSAPDNGPLVLTIRPGETIRARVRLKRLKHKGVVSFGKEDSGRNLPHGVYVDNIGLNGLLLLSEQSEREFFITASKVVPSSTSTFYLKSNVDSITSQPVTLRVVADDENAAERVTAR